MAGDWIKFEIDTPDKPEVIAIASRLGIDQDAVVGKLLRVWSWFDKHSTNGHAQSVTLSQIDRITFTTGFGEQMVFVGWLDQIGSELIMKNFDYHNGESAKKRATDTKRKQNQRLKEKLVLPIVSDICHKKIGTESGLEKRREENIYTPSFELFWKAYDKPKGKSNAFKIWKSLKVDESKQVEIIAKAKTQTTVVDRQYRKDAERWLKGCHWEDELILETSKSNNDYFKSMVQS